MSARLAPSQALAQVGADLPTVAAPIAAYVPAGYGSGVGGDAPVLVRTSGQLPMRDGQLVATGKLGAGVSVEEGYACARQCALGALAAAADLVGGIDRLRAAVRVTAFVASAPDFTQQAQVANGASELLGEVFAAPGKDQYGRDYPSAHTRSAVGVAVLPLDAPVEIEVEFLADVDS
ncbi:MAG: RidA family protein [Actinomycetaceae bacterium]|nr:RidA family protein [Actinomycetaceae bacterium]